MSSKQNEPVNIPDHKPIPSPLPAWRPEEWLAAQPYWRGMAGTIAILVVLGVVHLIVGLPTAVYFGLGVPLILIYYHCLTRLKRMVRQVRTRRDQCRASDARSFESK